MIIAYMNNSREEQMREYEKVVGKKAARKQRKVEKKAWRKLDKLRFAWF